MNSKCIGSLKKDQGLYTLFAALNKKQIAF